MRSPDWTWDELLLICSHVVKNDWRQLRAYQQPTQDLAELLRSLPLHRDVPRDVPAFRSAASVSRKSADLITGRPDHSGPATKGGQLTRLVAKAFVEHETEMLLAAKAIEDGIASGELFLIPEQPDEVAENGVPATEGQLLARWATFRERNPALRKRKIAQAHRNGTPLQCSVCDFRFDQTYGSLGEGYIEVHHTLPLHLSGPRETRLEDLAFLCANCHRMCHRSHRGTVWRTPTALRAEIGKST
ncbi:HNH endonuclease [Streptomyces sp. NPDC001108]